MKPLTDEIPIASTMNLGAQPQDPKTRHPSSTPITLTQVTEEKLNAPSQALVEVIFLARSFFCLYVILFLVFISQPAI